jgi:hypothetical protein
MSAAAASIVPKRTRQLLQWSALGLKPLVPTMVLPACEGKVVLVENVAYVLSLFSRCWWMKWRMKMEKKGRMSQKKKMEEEEEQQQQQQTTTTGEMDCYCCCCCCLLLLDEMENGEERRKRKD